MGTPVSPGERGSSGDCSPFEGEFGVLGKRDNDRETAEEGEER